jgi:hypothetical protein
MVCLDAHLYEIEYMRWFCGSVKSDNCQIRVGVF